MRSRRLLLSAVGVVAALVAGGAPVAAAAAPTPPPRIVDLKPRVIDLKPKQSKHTYTVDADVLFAFDSAKLSPDATSVLDDVVRTLREDEATKVKVTGYTDAIGSTSYNQSLSERRAKAVRDHLEAKVGSSSYTAVGRGEANPVAPNAKPGGADNPDGRRKNRRVVIAYSTG